MDLIDTIGNTTLLNLTPCIESAFVGIKSKPQSIAFPYSTRDKPSLKTSIFAKCEYLNPTGSIKDRIAAYMLERAEENGDLKGVDTLIESTSGNTGAAVARMAALKGYRALLVIPDRVSQEKQAILHALGAEVKVMPSNASIDSESHYMNVAKHLAQSTPNSFYLNQYHSLHNAAAHYYTTGPEIWQQMQGDIDIFISVIGSGGTVSGVGRYLKEKNPKIKVIAVDPVGSFYNYHFKKEPLSKNQLIKSSCVEGAGSDHMTQAIDFSVIDEIIQFEDKDAFEVARWLAKNTGILVGGSSGANLWAALHIAQRIDTPQRIVTIFPDSGMKYLSKFYQDTWMQSNGFLTDLSA